MKDCHSGTASGCRSSVEATYGQKTPVVTLKNSTTPFSLFTWVLWRCTMRGLCLAVIKFSVEDGRAALARSSAESTVSARICDRDGMCTTRLRTALSEKCLSKNVGRRDAVDILLSGFCIKRGGFQEKSSSSS